MLRHLKNILCKIEPIKIAQSKEAVTTVRDMVAIPNMLNATSKRDKVYKEPKRS